MKTWNKTIGSRIGHALAFLGVFATAVAVVMFVWNAIIPSVIGWSSVTYAQAAGLIILGRLLIGGSFYPLGFFFHPNLRQKQEHLHFREKLHRMSWEERGEFIRRRMSGREKASEPDREKEDK